MAIAQYCSPQRDPAPKGPIQEQRNQSADCSRKRKRKLDRVSPKVGYMSVACYGGMTLEKINLDFNKKRDKIKSSSKKGAWEERPWSINRTEEGTGANNVQRS